MKILWWKENGRGGRKQHVYWVGYTSVVFSMPVGSGEVDLMEIHPAMNYILSVVILMSGDS